MVAEVETGTGGGGGRGEGGISAIMLVVGPLTTREFRASASFLLLM